MPATACQRVTIVETAALLAQAISIGRELVRICDAVDQPIAGNHIALGLELLAAHRDLAAELASGDPHEIAADQLDAARGEADQAAARVEMVVHPLDQLAPGQRL